MKEAFTLKPEAEQEDEVVVEDVADLPPSQESDEELQSMMTASSRSTAFGASSSKQVPTQPKTSARVAPAASSVARVSSQMAASPRAPPAAAIHRVAASPRAAATQLEPSAHMGRFKPVTIRSNPQFAGATKDAGSRRQSNENEKVPNQKDHAIDADLVNNIDETVLSLLSDPTVDQIKASLSELLGMMVADEKLMTDMVVANERADAVTTCQTYLPKLQTLIAKAGETSGALKQKCSARQYRLLDGLKEAFGSKFEEMIIQPMRTYKKLLTEFCSARPDAANMMVYLLSTENRSLPCPKAVMLKVVEEGACMYSRVANQADLKKLINLSDPTNRLTIATGSRAGAVTKFILEKTLLRLVPSRGSTAVVGDKVGQVLNGFLSPLNDWHCLDAAEADVVKTLSAASAPVNATSCDSVQQNLTEFLCAAESEEFWLKGLVALPNFQDFVEKQQAALTKIAGKDCGRQLRRLHELLRELQVLESDPAQFNRSQCLEKVDEVVKLIKVTYNNLMKQPIESEADVSRRDVLKQALQAVLDYEMAAFCAWDEDFAQCISRFGEVNEQVYANLTDMFEKKVYRAQQLASKPFPEFHEQMEPARVVAELLKLTSPLWAACVELQALQTLASVDGAVSLETFEEMVRTSSKIVAARERLFRKREKCISQYAEVGLPIAKARSSLDSFFAKLSGKDIGTKVFAEIFDEFAQIAVKKLQVEAINATELATLKDIIATNGQRLRQVAMWTDTPKGSTTAVIVGLSVVKLINNRMQVVDFLSARSFSEDQVKVIHESIIAASTIAPDVLSNEDLAVHWSRCSGLWRRRSL